MQRTHSVLHPLTSLAISVRVVCHFPSDLVDGQSSEGADFSSDAVHEICDGGLGDGGLHPAIVSVEEVAENCKSCRCSLLVVDVFDGLGDFEGGDVVGQHLESIAVAELARVRTLKRGLHLPHRHVELHAAATLLEQ